MERRRRARPRRAACAATRSRREMVFVSHETYTPARGGSAAAEIHALRQVFGDDADRIVIANTKGFTGHPMGVGLEDVAGGQGARDGHRAAGAELPRGRPGARRRSTCRTAAPTRCATRCAWPRASARRSACCCCAGPRSADGRRRQPRRARLRLPHRRPRRLDGVAAPRERSGRAAARGRPAPPARRRPGTGRPRAAPEPVSRPEAARAPVARAGRSCRSRRRPPRADAGARPGAGARRRAARPRRHRRAVTASRRGCWRSSPSRRAIRRICWTWISIWRPIWGSTRSSRRRCSRRSARPTGSSATTR